MNTVHIVPASKEDVASIKKIIDSSELFPSELIDDMIASYLDKTAPHEIWLTAKRKDIAVAVAFCAPEPMTQGTYNLYMIAVKKESQHNGIGSQLMSFIEEKLATEGVRLLIVETAGTDQFILTRDFYDKLNYERVGYIPNFYSEGEDKVIFSKSLV